MLEDTGAVNDALETPNEVAAEENVEKIGRAHV